MKTVRALNTDLGVLREPQYGDDMGDSQSRLQPTLGAENVVQSRGRPQDPHPKAQVDRPLASITVEDADARKPAASSKGAHGPSFTNVLIRNIKEKGPEGEDRQSAGLLKPPSRRLVRTTEQPCPPAGEDRPAGLLVERPQGLDQASTNALAQ